MKKLYPILTFAGALPFVICALLVAIDIQMIPLLGATQDVLGLYTLVITSFMAGSHWGQHLERTDQWSIKLPVYSNIVAVVVWICYLMFSQKSFLLTNIIVFLFLLKIDHQLYKRTMITENYFKTRCAVTAIVTVCLGIAGVMI